MIALLTIICRTCGRPHVSTFRAARACKTCPFCGSRIAPRVIPHSPISDEDVAAVAALRLAA